MTEKISIGEAVAWLDGQAAYYELANNTAMHSTRYHREDTVAWKVARLLEELSAAGQTLPGTKED